jgi:hypothetical protein
MMTNCYLCEKSYLSGENSYLYICYDCKNKTSVCLNCDKIMMKIFENNNIFKCGCCRKIVPAISKQLIEINNNSINLSQLSQLNQLMNISAINENNLSPNKNIDENNNNNNISKFETPKENRVIYQHLGNKIFINTPSSVGSLINDLNNNNSELNKQKEIDNNTNNNNVKNFPSLTDINNSFKNNKDFSLIMDNKEIKLMNNKPKGIANYFLYNELNSNNLLNQRSEIKDQNKSDFSGYNKVINEKKNDLSGYKINK